MPEPFWAEIRDFSQLTASIPYWGIYTTGNCGYWPCIWLFAAWNSSCFYGNMRLNREKNKKNSYLPVTKQTAHKKKKDRDQNELQTRNDANELNRQNLEVEMKAGKRTKSETKEGSGQKRTAEQRNK